MNFINKISLSVLLLLMTIFYAEGQTWQLNEKESSVIFIAKNLGMKVSGIITGMEVTGVYNSENIFASNFIGTVDVSTIDTQIKARDNHLKSSDYFNVNKYPTIIFKSKKISEEGSSLKVTGDLTIKGVTKEVDIVFTVQKKEKLHTLVGNVMIQRKDFYLGSNTTLIMADTIQVRIVAAFVLN